MLWYTAGTAILVEALLWLQALHTIEEQRAGPAFTRSRRRAYLWLLGAAVLVGAGSAGLIVGGHAGWIFWPLCGVVALVVVYGIVGALLR